MKRLHLCVLICAILCMFSYRAYAQTGSTVPFFGQDQCLYVAEEDDDPFNIICGALKVPNGTLTNNGDGTFSFVPTISGGSTISGTLNITGVADHEWAPTTFDLRVGDNVDEGQIKVGNVVMGQADDTVGGTVMDDIFIIYNNSDSVEDIAMMYVSASDVPRFVLVEEGSDLATYNPRSFLIGPAATLSNVDENIQCSTRHDKIDCDTGGSGADLGVQDDVEVDGMIYADGGLQVIGTLTLPADSIVEADLKAVDAAADEECLTYETTTGDFEWQSCGGAGGSPGGNDTEVQYNNAASFGGISILTYDGTNITLSGTMIVSGTINSTNSSGIFPLYHVRDEKAAGTKGGTFTAGAWRTRDLNTVKTNEISGASLSSNQITLPAGTYYVEARAPAYYVNNNKLKWYNASDTSDVIIGETGRAETSDGNLFYTEVSGRFTISTEKDFELQHYCQSTMSDNGFGRAYNLSVVEVYADVKIWKVSE